MNLGKCDSSGAWTWMSRGGNVNVELYDSVVLLQLCSREHLDS